MSTKPKKSSTRSKVDPYLLLRNWMPGGQCAFWENSSIHNPELYAPSISEAISKDRSIVTFQENVGKNHSIR